MNISYYELIKIAEDRKNLPDEGIPNKNEFGVFTSDQIGKRNWIVTIQEHNALRAGKHWDIRVVDDKGRAYSWSTRHIEDFFNPSSRGYAKQQPIHTKEYSFWSGILSSGYGAGTVKLIYSGPAEVLDARPDKLTILIPKGKVPMEITFKKMKGRDWLLINSTTTKDKYDIPHTKGDYKEIPFDTVKTDNPDEVITAKIDGSHAIILLEPDKRPRVFSYRESKKGVPLEYTYKLPQKFYIERWQGAPLLIRGEIFGVDKNGKSITERELAAILNANIENARKYMEEKGITLKIAPFEVERINHKPVKLSYEEQLKILKDVVKNLSHAELPDYAVEKAKKEKLIKLIRTGKHPQTVEGVILRSLTNPESKPVKAKIRRDFDVLVKKIFAEKGGIELPKDYKKKYKKKILLPSGKIKYKYEEQRPRMAGGFLYAWPENPNKIVGKVGTGFSFELKQDMLKHPEKYENLIARVIAQEKFPSGSLRAPVFAGWHYEKSGPRALKAKEK